MDLITDLSPQFWLELTERAAISYESLIQRFQAIRGELWTGKMDEENFWIYLCSQFPSIDLNEAKKMLHSNLRPLPAMKRILNGVS